MSYSSNRFLRSGALLGTVAAWVLVAAEARAQDRAAPSLPTITIEGQNEGVTTEGTDSYTTGKVTIGKDAQPLRAIPQSVSVVTRQRIEDQNLTTLDEAARRVPGLLVLQNDRGRSSVFSRGFEFDTFQIDGLPAPLSSIYGTQPDLAPFDRIEVLRGPGGRTVSAADFYLFAGDQTALPAISAILEKLPADARGEAFIEIPDAGEEQRLARPAGVRVHWLHRGDVAAGRATLLQDAVRAFPWPDAERIFAWIGCESAAMRELRAYVRDERKLDSRSILAIGYWRIGMTETEYGKSFKNDRDEDYFRTMQEEMQATRTHAVPKA